MPDLAVVIPTYNRAGYLADALRSLADQDAAAGTFEVVVVDDGSTDHTAEAVREAQSAGLSVHYVHQENAGLNVGRNRGAAESSAPLIAYLDDDTLLDPRWAREVVAGFEALGCDGLAGRIRLQLEGSRPQWLVGRLRTYLSELDLGDEPRRIGDGVYPFGANCAVTREAYDRVGGFAPGLDRAGTSLLSGGDVELFQRVERAGGTLGYWPGAAVRHRVPVERLDVAWFRRRTRAAGVSDVLLEPPTSGGPGALVREAARAWRALPILAKGMASGRGTVNAVLWLDYVRGRLWALRSDAELPVVGSPVAGDRPDVTVVIPTRDRLPLLQEAVASVLDQSGPSWELVVVPDGCTDATVEWLRQLTSAHDRVRAEVLAEHSERSAARNRGLEVARADLVMFLDDDDRLRPGALAVLVGAMQRHGAAVAAVGAAEAFTGEQRRRIDHPRRAHVRPVLAEAVYGWLGMQGSAVYRTAAVRRVGGWRRDLTQGEDQDLTSRLAAEGPFALVPQVVLENRREGTVARRPPDTEHIERRIREELVEELDAVDHPRAAEARAALVARHASKAGLAAWEDGDHRSALRHFTACIRACPALLRSPIIGPRLRSLWMRSLLGSLMGRRATSAARSAVWAVRRRLDRAIDPPAS